MKALYTLLLVASTLTVTACGGRQVEVQTGPQQQSEVGIHFTNNTASQVNVYVHYNGNRIFVGQVSGNSTQHLNVSGVPAGSTVDLEATQVGGNNLRYTKNGVTASAMTDWRIP